MPVNIHFIVKNPDYQDCPIRHLLIENHVPSIMVFSITGTHMLIRLPDMSRIISNQSKADNKPDK